MGGSSGGSSGSSTTSTTQTTEPWDQQKPYLIRGFNEASAQYDSSKPEYYPGSTVVPLSPETEQSLDMRSSQATDPNSLVNQAGGQTAATLRGDYLDADNPVYRSMLEGVTRQVRPGVDTGYTLAGRSGTSPGHTEALARGISAGMLPYIQSERGRQYQASLDAATTSQYAPDLLAGVGAARERQTGAELQDDINRYNFEQTKDQAKLREYMANITGNYGGTVDASTRTPIYSNNLQSGIAAGTGLASIGTSLFAPKSSTGGGIISGNKG